MTNNYGLDNQLGPQFGHDFDFTLLFEHTIFTVLPSAVFLCIAPPYIFRLLNRPILIRPGLLLWGKLGSAILLLGVQLASLLVWSLPSTSGALHTDTSTAAAVLSFIDVIAIAVIIFAEHRHSLQPSSFLSAYLTLTVLLDATCVRSLFKRGNGQASVLASLAIVGIVFKIVLLLLEEVPKTNLLQRKSSEFANHGYEAVSGLWNRSFFWWLNSTLVDGFRSILEIGSLEGIGPSFDSEKLHARLQKYLLRGNSASRHHLVKATSLTLIWPFLATVSPRLCFSGFNFAQVFLLNTIVSAVDNGVLSRDVTAGLIGATALVYVGIAVSSTYYKHLTYRYITMIRGALVSTIFNRVLTLEADAAKASAAVTLMSTDIDGIMYGLETVHEIWGSIIDLGIGIYLLSRFVGAATFLVVIPTILTTIGTPYIARGMGPARVRWNEMVEKRVSVTSDMLGQIKSVKMLGLGQVVARYIQSLRVTEVECSKRFRVLIVTMDALGSLSTSMTPVIVIAGALFWTRSQDLDAPHAFTTLSIIALVSTPISTVLIAYPQAASTLGCFGRIQHFLGKPNGSHGPRNIENSAPPPATTSGASSGYELQSMTAASEQCVRISEASIAATEHGDVVLRGVSIDIPRSSLSMVVGPVGSGKSTLLRAILGEVPLLQGSIKRLSSPVAYCDQVPWLQNISIRQNIVGQDQFDKAWYQAVVSACALDIDMQQLPEGDQTLVGTGGVSLSGGQKQRVALARAVYSKESLVLLDDALSALDSTTARVCFSRLMGPEGLWRKGDTAVVMVTHAVEFLPHADQVIVVRNDGSVTVGAARGNIPQMNQESFDPKHVCHDGPGEPIVADISSNRPSKPASKTAGNSKERQMGDLKLYSFYFASVGPFLFCVWLLLAAIYVAADKMPNVWLRIWLDRDSGNDRYFGGYAAWGVTGSITCFCAMGYYMLWLIPRSAEYLHWLLLDTVMRAKLWFYTSTDMGTVINRFSQDMTLINQMLPMTIFQLTIYMFNVIAAIALIVAGTPYLAAFIPPSTVALYLLQKYYLRTSRQMRHLDLEAKSPLYTLFSETSAGIRTVRANGWQAAFSRRCTELLDLSQKPYYLLFCIQRWLSLVLDLYVAGLAVLLVGFALGLMRNTTQAGMGLAMINLIGFGQMLSQVVSSWTNVETSLGAVARLRSFVTDTPVEPASRGEPESHPLTRWPSQGRVELVSVSARYNNDDPTAPLALKDVSLTIEPGQTVGLVGRTGSGKSSLLLALLRMLEYTGTIRIDGTDISTIPHETVRSQVTTLSQDPVLLPGSVRENLDPVAFLQQDTVEATAEKDAELVTALTRVGLWDTIRGRGGLGADVSTLGLSHGERQLLSLARALLHCQSTSGRLVLVDEATSGMDQDTDRRMQDVMLDIFAGCTVLVIAHRLETIKNADLVVEMAGGGIVGVRNREI